MNQIKLILFILISAILFSCSKRNFTHKIELKSVPITLSAENESRRLIEYYTKFNTIEIDSILNRLKSKREKKEFNYRILEFKIVFNKCIDSLIDIKNADSAIRLKKLRELKEKMNELEALWKYIIVNYRI